jgi:predicted TIM-barrel fold metal-dependent hydrolase
VHDSRERISPHAGWPFVLDMIAVAWRCENVFFENSFYHFTPGAGILVNAANSMIGDKMLYASAYPFSPIGETLERFRALPFKPDVAEKVLHINADKLLRRIANNRAAASLGLHR